MKVPVYKVQAKRQTGAIAPQVSSQVSPRSVGAVAEALSDVGNLLFEAGKEKVRIHNETQAIKANKAMEVELRAIADDAVNQDITVYTPAEVQAKMDAVYNKYANGTAIDSATGKSYLGTSRARSVFQSLGYDTYQGYVSSYRKSSTKMLAKQAEVNIVTRVRDEVKIAADTDSKLGERRTALDNLMSQEFLDDTVLGVSRRRGLLVYSATSGVMTAEKSTALIESTMEDLALGIAMSYMGDDSYAETASDFVDGDLEARDEILQEVLVELSPDQREALNRKVIDYANKNVTRLEEEAKAIDEELQARLDAQQRELVNIADTEPERARMLFEDLKANNYYTVTTLKGTKKLLGLIDEDDRPEDDPRAVLRMYQLMQTQELTIEEVFRHEKSLPKSIKKFYDMAISLQDEGVQEGTKLITTAIGYEKYKDVPGIKEDADVFFQRAMNDFTAWRVRKPDPGQPLSGGRGATYDMIVAYAEKIAEKYGKSLKASIQASFDKQADSLIDQIVSSKRGVYSAPADGNRREAISNWVKSLSDTDRKDILVMSIYEQFKRYESEDVR